MKTLKTADQIRKDWAENPRWKGIKRTYRAEDVVRLRGSITVEHTLAQLGADRLWKLLHTEAPVRALGAITGNQAMEMVQAGLMAIYGSGWQVAGDGNSASQIYPDQSLYPVDSGPTLVRRLNNALLRADQITHSEGAKDAPYWLAPIVADMEAGFGGNLNTFELMKAMIEAGVSGVHLEDQLSSQKKCGHMGGKVVVPTSEAIGKLMSARLASDVLDVPTIIIARTDANGAKLLRNDTDERDWPFIETRERTPEGFYRFQEGIAAATSRGVSFAPYADMLWCETASPDIDEAKAFAEGVHRHYPDKLLAYNCSPSFNWSAKLDASTIAKFQRELAAMGYAFQFITLAGFHALNASIYELAVGYRDHGMSAYAKLQDREFEMARDHGYTAVKHQRFVGTGYFDDIAETISGGETSTAALRGSTEEAQFHGTIGRG